MDKNDIKRIVFQKWAELGFTKDEIKKIITHPLLKVAFSKLDELPKLLAKNNITKEDILNGKIVQNKSGFCLIKESEDQSVLPFLFDVLFKWFPVVSFAIPAVGGGLYYQLTKQKPIWEKLQDARMKYLNKTMSNPETIKDMSIKDEYKY